MGEKKSAEKDKPSSPWSMSHHGAVARSDGPVMEEEEFRSTCRGRSSIQNSKQVCAEKKTLGDRWLSRARSTPSTCVFHSSAMGHY